MPTVNQRRYRQVQNQSAATGGQTAAPQTQYFWHGYGETDSIGIVRAADGSFHRGSISGNEIPGTGARVGFTPGNPLGQIQLQTIGTGTQSAVAAVAAGGADLAYNSGDPNTTGPSSGPVTPITGFIFDTVAAQLYNANEAGSAWVQVSGGAAIQYHNGDPNHNSIVPISGRLYDIMAEREFIPGVGAVPTEWVTTAKIMFVFEGPIGQQYYPGDSYWGSDQCLQVFNGLDWEGSCSETGGPYGDGAYCGPPL